MVNKSTIVTALVVVGNGTEEIEMICPVDILRRAGIDVTVASASGKEVKGANGITFLADKTVDEAIKKQYDCLILPGGPGVFDMRTNQRVLDLIKAYHKGNKLIGAICAAPILLKDAGVLPMKYTSHPCVHNELIKSSPNPIIEDKNFITARGPGVASQFAFALLKHLRGQDVVEQLSKTMQYE